MDHPALPYDFLLFTHKERLPDRFLETQLHHPDLGGSAATLIIHVEILNPWHPTNELGQSVIGNLVREFARSHHPSLLGRFESALKFTNRTLSEAVDKLQAGVACVSALIVDQEVHFSAAGEAAVLLWRDNKLVSLYPGKAGSLSEFSAITSGDLNQSDWLIIGNGPFAALIREFSDELSNEQRSLSGLEAMIVGAIDPAKRTEFSGIMLRHSSTPEQRAMIWEEQEPTLPIRLPQLRLPAFKLEAGRLSHLVKSIGAGLGQLWQKLRALRLPRLGAGLSLPSFRPGPGVIRSGFIALLIAALIGGGILAYRQIRRSFAPEASAKTLTEELAEQAAAERLGWLEQNYDHQRWDILSDTQKNELVTLLREAGITVVELGTPVSELPEIAVAMDTIGDRPVVVDETGQVWLWREGLPVKLEQSRLIIEPKSLASFAEDRIVVSDASGNIWLINESPSSPLALALPSVIAGSVKLLAQFANNLYLFHQSSGDFYRVLNFSTDLSGATLYAPKDSINLTTLSDWGINGQIVVVDEVGQVFSFRRNERTELAASRDGATAPLRLATDEADSRLYLLSDRTLSVFSATGEVLKTVFFTTEVALADLALGNPSQLWLVSQTKLYQTTLSF